MNFDETQAIRILVFQCKALIATIERSLNDSATMELGRYASFKTYAREYNDLVQKVERALKLKSPAFNTFILEKMPGWGDSVWPLQKQYMESVLLESKTLLAYLEAATDFSEDEFSNLENFIKTRLRAAIFSTPEKEVQVQNAIETLLVGKGWSKGIDYDRESGKFEFSGKEYIPDFIVPKLALCIEVKLLREGKKSRIIDEINTDITAYSSHYMRQMFVVYDLGVIRDESEFRRDIENAGDAIKVVIVKQ